MVPSRSTMAAWKRVVDNGMAEQRVGESGRECHPLTAPAVSPVMICRAATNVKISRAQHQRDGGGHDTHKQAVEQIAVELVFFQHRTVVFQAVVCVSDHAAFGALMECQRRGWAVPERLAIAGFGGFEVATACHPRLTTVAVDCVGIGRAAGELLLRAIDAARQGQRLAAETVVIPFRIEQREST